MLSDRVGIFPENVNSYSEESLLWSPPEVTRDEALPRCEGLQFDVFNSEDEEYKMAQKEKDSDILEKFAAEKRKESGTIYGSRCGNRAGSFP